MSTTHGLQDSVNFFFTLLVFVPVNLIVMALAWGAMALANRILGLRFSAITIVVGASILVFAFVFNWLNDLDDQRGWVSFDAAPTGLYAFTAIVGGVNLAIVLLVTFFVRRAKRKNPPPLATPPLWTKGRKIATATWLLLTGTLLAMPLMRDASTALTEHQSEAALVKLADIIERNDVAAFKKKAQEDTRLWEAKLPGEEHALFDVLIQRDRVEMVELLVSQDKRLFDYTFDFKVQSTAMADMLIKERMPADKLIMEIADQDQDAIVRHIVEKHYPRFNQWVELIIFKLMRDGKTDLLLYLSEHGLGGNPTQATAAIWGRLQHNDLKGLQQLAALGFPIDATNPRLPHMAVLNGNLPMLQWLLERPFDINARVDDYTPVETAILSNKEDILDYLLTLRPDVETLHPTTRDGETNALLLAERYKQPVMLAKLKVYAATAK